METKPKRKQSDVDMLLIEIMTIFYAFFEDLSLAALATINDFNTEHF